MSELPKNSPYAFYAFYQLYNHLNSSAHPSSSNSTETGNKRFLEICKALYPTVKLDPTEKTSLFVTWKKKSKHSGDYVLRGCIGTFAKPPVVQGIEKYSLIAALQDHRFSPITKNELPLLKCCCNILQNFTTIYDRTKGDIYDWEIGLHGIELLFKHPQTGSVVSATFLPDVMTEQGWDKEETFLNLIYKAGVSSHVQEIMDHYDQYFIEVIRYEGNKSAITYEGFEARLTKLKQQ